MWWSSVSKLSFWCDHANLYTVGTDGYLGDENGVSDEFLKMMLSKAGAMGGFDIMQTEFILDIDLDKMAQTSRWTQIFKQSSGPERSCSNRGEFPP